MLIDPAIRDWVMIPLLAVVVIVHYSQMYITTLITSDREMDAKETGQRNLLARSQRLRANGGYISHTGFTMRKHYLANSDSDEKGPTVGKLKQEVPAGGQPPMNQATEGMMIMVRKMPQRARVASVRVSPSRPSLPHHARSCR